MNRPWNLVLLTAKEHFVVHHLLTKIKIDRIGHQKLCSAFIAFTRDKTGNRNLTQKQYEIVRKEFSKWNTLTKTGFKPTEKTRKKMSVSHLGKKQNIEWITKRVESKKGYTHSADTRKKIAKNRDYTKSRTIKRRFNLHSSS